MDNTQPHTTCVCELDASKKSLLIDGFCTTHHFDPIPTDICDLIAQFNKSIVWIIQNEAVQQLSPIQINNDHLVELHRLNGPIFSIYLSDHENNIKFQLKIEHTSKNNIELHLVLISKLPERHIKNMTMRVSLICNETQTEKRQFCLIDNDYNYIELFEQDILPFDEILKYKQLVISCNVEILSIEYLKNTHNPYIKPIKLNQYDKETQFEWDITKNILNQFKSARNGETFWPKNNFGPNDNFCVTCMPNLNGACILILKLLALQYPLKGIYVSYTMEIQSDTNNFYKKYERKSQWLSGQSTLSWTDDAITTLQLNTFENIKFIVTLKIIQHTRNYVVI